MYNGRKETTIPNKNNSSNKHRKNEVNIKITIRTTKQ